MALTTHLALRQGLNLSMTPQLLQAIKLLQFSSLELTAFINEELERNPLLELQQEKIEPRDVPIEKSDRKVGDWAEDKIENDPQRLADNLGAGIDNVFKNDDFPYQYPKISEKPELSQRSAVGTSLSRSEEAPNLDSYTTQLPNMREDLATQLAQLNLMPNLRRLALIIIDEIDESGYLNDSLPELSQRYQASIDHFEKALNYVQSLDPAGIGARSLRECLMLQLKERNRLDPAMQKLLDHLPILAKRDFAALKKLCDVDEEDLADMVREIRRLDPKPGRRFDRSFVQTIIPDVLVSVAPDGTWIIEINPITLPRLLVNKHYSSAALNDGDKTFINQCLQNAHWLTRSLDQRAKTIIKVAAEIVKHQDGFLTHGIAHLRPLNLKTVANAISLHQSTVSRATTNKFIATPRGIFEFKYFFTPAIAAADGKQAYSSEAIRFKIKQMIESEPADAILSDDAIVRRLADEKIDIARRTVAKYRESLHIPSSATRKRERKTINHRI